MNRSSPLLLCIAAMLIGCGTFEPAHHSTEVIIKDAEVQDYYKEFMVYCSAYRGDDGCGSALLKEIDYLEITKGSGTVDTNELGRCMETTTYSSTQGYTSRKTIILKYNLRGSALRGVLFHELGHCLLGKDHSNIPHHPMHDTFNYSCLRDEQLSEGCLAELFR